GAITDVDYSAARTLTDLVRSLHARGIGVLFGRVNRYLRADMDRHGITEVVGATCIFATLHAASFVTTLRLPLRSSGAGD
ncbi:sodium-independent anion transporter, partial [Burkholderia cenocepacia]|uniref:sodium-independent anion transporter n=1 Tax=Burkholderia cenocepacia TaxID=95486 RepID=UPI0024B7BB73